MDQGPDQQPVLTSVSSSAGIGTKSVEDWLARRLGQAGLFELPDRLLRVLNVLGRWDRRTYEAVAGLSTPLLDEPMRVVSRVANGAVTRAVIERATSSVAGRLWRPT